MARPFIASRAPEEALEAVWTLPALSGRLVELPPGLGASGALSLAFSLVLEAQRQGEVAAWIGRGAGGFYPPDAALGGVDLSALAVVRVEGASAQARAADKLLRSGAFGLLILDLGAGALAMALQSHLVALPKSTARPSCSNLWRWGF